MNTTWFEDAIFYHIYPLGFCGAPPENSGSSNKEERLLKILDWIPHMESLGITALYLGPVFESETHGYDTRNFYALDERLGSNTTLKTVIDTLHQHNIKVILDAVFNHVGRTFPQFQDVQSKREGSLYTSWFHSLDFSKNNAYQDNFSYASWNGCENLVKLQVDNPEVSEHIFQAVSFWVSSFDIDGIRIDAADQLSDNFINGLTEHCKQLKPGFLLLGEIVCGNYQHWLRPGALDSVTNYECFKGLYSSFNERNMFEIAHSLNRLFSTKSEHYISHPLYSFADNHDVNRVASLLNNKTHLFPLYLLLFTMPGIPAIYYGSEWGAEGTRSQHSDQPLRPSMEQIETYRSRIPELIDTIKTCSYLRSQLTALRKGGFEQIIVQSEYVVFSRFTDSQKILVIIHMNEHTISIDIPVTTHTSSAFDHLNKESCTLKNNTLKVTLYPNWGRIIELF